MDIPPLADYVASKAALRGLFRAIRLPMRDLGIRTNMIAPWLMDTPMVTAFAARFRERGVPVGRPVDVAEAVLRCCVDEGICGELASKGGWIGGWIYGMLMVGFRQGDRGGCGGDV